MELMRPSRGNPTDDRGGPRSPKDAPVLRPPLRPDAGTQWVIAMGELCILRRGLQQLRHRAGVDEVVPVDVYVAAPPRPEALIHGIVTLLRRSKGEVRRSCEI